MVMGGDSCYEGCGFKSQQCILDGHFSHLFVVKLYSLFEKTKINKKRPRMAHFFKKTQYLGRRTLQMFKFNCKNDSLVT